MGHLGLIAATIRELGIIERIVLHGRYDDAEPVEGIPSPTYGYSKAKRSDLKQVMLSLTQGGVANIPLWMEPLNGNSSDKTSFQETVKRVQAFTKNLNAMPDGLCFVVDAAFYVPEKLAQLNDVHWITRVPAQLKEAKSWLKTPSDQLIWHTFNENYRAVEQEIVIHDIKQRWLLLESKHAQKRELETFQRRLDKKANELTKAIWHLGNQEFQCENDAKKAMKPLLKSLKYHSIEYQIVPIKRYEGKGRQKKDAEKKSLVIKFRLHYPHVL